MASGIRQFTEKVLGPVLWNLCLMAVGSIICAIGVNGILIPQQFFGAGFTGMALIIHYLVPSLSVAVVYLFLNVPVFALGWIYVGRRFFLYSIAGVVIYTAALALVHIPVSVQDKILGALLAGILVGVGSGIILKSLGSAGGLDILSIIVFKIFSIRLGTTILASNGLVLIAGAFLFSLERSLYTLIYIYVTSRMVNLVVTGLSQRKALFIISTQWEKIAHEIMEKIQRGVTIIEGRGGYSGREIPILYTVIAFQDLPRLKEMARSIDRDVFIVVSDTQEVMGTRIGNQPHW